MRPENKAMQEFLMNNGIDATPKYLWKGSLKNTWRLYGKNTEWNDSLRENLTSLGFNDFDGNPLSKYSGNGGRFHVFVKGHNELINQKGESI